MISIFYTEICDNVVNHIDDGFIVQDITASLDIQSGSIFSSLNDAMQLKKKLLQRYPRGIYMNPDMKQEQYIFIPTCVLQDNVYNLVVRDKLWDIFNLSYLEITLKILKIALLYRMEQDPDFEIKLFMPIICPEISWFEIKQLLFETFNDLDIEIIICYQESQKKLLEG